MSMFAFSIDKKNQTSPLTNMDLCLVPKYKHFHVGLLMKPINIIFLLLSHYSFLPRCGCFCQASKSSSVALCVGDCSCPCWLQVNLRVIWLLYQQSFTLERPPEAMGAHKMGTYLWLPKTFQSGVGFYVWDDFSSHMLQWFPVTTP